MNLRKYISDIDSKRFGFPIAKINSFEVSPTLALDEFRKLGVKLVMSKINAKDIDRLNELESLGFRIKDGQLKYKFDLKKQEIPTLSSDSSAMIIRDFNASDEDEILTMLSESFVGYGHYFADNNLNREHCLEIYKDWGIQSCLNKKVADKVFVAEINQKVAGLLAFKILEQNKKIYAEGTVGAVSSKFRGLSVFKQLAIEGLNWGINEKFEWEEHNVLVTNFPVNSSFSSIGFKVKDSFYTLHCWL